MIYQSLCRTCLSVASDVQKPSLVMARGESERYSKQVEGSVVALAIVGPTLPDLSFFTILIVQLTKFKSVLIPSNLSHRGD